MELLVNLVASWVPQNSTRLISCNYPSWSVICQSCRWADGSLAKPPTVIANCELVAVQQLLGHIAKISVNIHSHVNLLLYNKNNTWCVDITWALVHLWTHCVTALIVATDAQNNQHMRITNKIFITFIFSFIANMKYHQASTHIRFWLNATLHARIIYGKVGPYANSSYLKGIF